MRFRRRNRSDSVATLTLSGLELPATFNAVADLVERHAAEGRQALIFVDREGVVQRTTYLDLARNAARWAHVLRSRIAEPGPAVLLATGEAPDSLAAVLGALKGGLVPALCASGLDDAELRRMVEATGARLVVSGERPGDAVGAPVLSLAEARDEARRHHPVAPSERRPVTAPAFVLFADDGTPYVHSQATLWAAQTVGADWPGIRATDVVWGAFPPGSWRFTWHGLLTPLALGASFVVHDAEFDAAVRWGLIERLGVTILGLELSAAAALASAPPAGGPSKTLRGVYVVEAAGDATTPTAAELAPGLNLSEGVGSAAAPLGLVGASGGTWRAPAGIELVSLDAAGHPLGAGELGELAVSATSLLSPAEPSGNRAPTRLGLHGRVHAEGGVQLAAEAEVEELRAADRRAHEEAERVAAERARVEAERQAAEEAAQLEAERVAAERARVEAERHGAEEAARVEAEHQAQVDADRQAAERARADAEQRAREEAELRARAETARIAAAEAARAEAEREARQAAERQAQFDADRRAAEESARAEAERKAREETDRRAAEEATRVEAERQAREESERRAQEDAERRAAEEAERPAPEAATPPPPAPGPPTIPAAIPDDEVIPGIAERIRRYAGTDDS